MARGPSGRIVIEMDPEMKRELHASLVAEGTSLKEWFIAQASAHLRSRREPDLPGLENTSGGFYAKAAEDPAPYNSQKQ